MRQSSHQQLEFVHQFELFLLEHQLHRPLHFEFQPKLQQSDLPNLKVGFIDLFFFAGTRKVHPQV